MKEESNFNNEKFKLWGYISNWKIQDIVFEQKLWKRTKLLELIILLKEQKGKWL